jgi:hypothetical protein
MRLSIRFLVAAAILTAAIAARADAIAGMTGGSVTSIEINDPEGVSWTQTGSYTNVAISAFLSAFGGNGGGTGTIYLTDQIGLGTTTANEIAETTVSGLASAPATATSLFSGLDLGPGTYYLITASNLGGNGLAWNEYSGNAAISGISGTNNFDEFGSGEAGYPPSSFLFTDGTHEFDFSVTGDIAAATPEPSSFILLGTGLLGIVQMTRRKCFGH